jgi:hypothetical protein
MKHIYEQSAELKRKAQEFSSLLLLTTSQRMSEEAFVRVF